MSKVIFEGRSCGCSRFNKRRHSRLGRVFALNLTFRVL